MFALIIGYCLTAFFVALSVTFAVVTISHVKKDKDPGAYAIVGLCFITLFAFLALGTAKLAGI